MKTECHCIFCPRHPRHEMRHKFPEWPVRFEPGELPYPSGCGAIVDCLEPNSRAFDEFDIDASSQEFPVTAYGDGCSITGFARDGLVLWATCKNEEYKP